jgi:hypothetical protein
MGFAAVTNYLVNGLRRGIISAGGCLLRAGSDRASNLPARLLLSSEPKSNSSSSHKLAIQPKE